MKEEQKAHREEMKALLAEQREREKELKGERKTEAEIQRCLDRLIAQVATP